MRFEISAPVHDLAGGGFPGSRAQAVHLRRYNEVDDVYLEQCLRKRLVLFIRRYHQGKKILFWPYLATSHYARAVQKFLTARGI